ncbi:MAG TPA: NIPSNAP family protein [Caldilineaceae bacterium]|nr:NIPSNAP family protein [Caldilineaceae bacterium]
MFFEFREYHAKPGKRAEMVRLMDEEIIPFQISKGMVVVASFVNEQDDEPDYWIRRFDSEEERVALYAAVYETDTWKNDFSPRMGELNDRSQIKVTRIVPTPKSVIR